MADWTKDIRKKREKLSPYGEKYFYSVDITIPLMVGFIIDNIVPATFGLFSFIGSKIKARSLKSFETPINNFTRLFKPIMR